MLSNKKSWRHFIINDLSQDRQRQPVPHKLWRHTQYIAAWFYLVSNHWYCGYCQPTVQLDPQFGSGNMPTGPKTSRQKPCAMSEPLQRRKETRTLYYSQSSNKDTTNGTKGIASNKGIPILVAPGLTTSSKSYYYPQSGLSIWDLNFEAYFSLGALSTSLPLISGKCLC